MTCSKMNLPLIVRNKKIKKSFYSVHALQGTLQVGVLQKNGKKMLACIFKVNPITLKPVRKSFLPLISTNHCYHFSSDVAENNSSGTCGMVGFLNSSYP